MPLLLLLLGLLIQATASLSLQPAQATLSPGETILFRLEIQSPDPVNAADVQLAYDPAHLEILDSDPAREGVQVAPGDFLAPDLVLRNEVTPGTIRFALAQISPSEPRSGSGLLFSFTARAMAPVPETLLQFEEAILTTSDGQAVPPALAGAAVLISGDGAPTRTPTAAAAATLPAGLSSAVAPPAAEASPPPAGQPASATPPAPGAGAGSSESATDPAPPTPDEGILSAASAPAPQPESRERPNAGRIPAGWAAGIALAAGALIFALRRGRSGRPES